MRNLCLLLICFCLTACAAQNGLTPGAKSPATKEVTVPFSQLQNELAKVPGIQIVDEDSLLFSFPTGELFTQGSALPMPGGTVPLDALVAVIKRSGLRWSLKIRANTGEGEAYDQELAATRVRILKTYFKC